VLESDVQDAFLFPIFLNKNETRSSFILNCCKQVLGVERAELLWAAPGNTASLRHWITVLLSEN